MEKKRSSEPSIDALLMQISEMLEMIQNPEKTITLNPDVIEQVKELEKAVTQLNENAEKEIKSAGFNLDELMHKTLESPAVSDREKQLLKRSKSIENHALAFKSALSKAMQRQKKSRKSKESPTAKERRKLFKSIGGDKKWISL